MLQLFSRTEFERAVVEHRAERHTREFSWSILSFSATEISG
jgi:hypothetical protein